MTGTNGTERSDLADTLIGLTVGFLFCVLCMVALAIWFGDEAQGVTKEERMEIGISVVDHSKQRYDTVGDWLTSERPYPLLHIFVSDLGDWKKEACVAYHELFEALMCKHLGITQQQVDAFDMAWTPHDGLDEPGDDPAAPYYAAHQQALVAERLLANALGLNWQEYEAALDAVGK